MAAAQMVLPVARTNGIKPAHAGSTVAAEPVDTAPPDGSWSAGETREDSPGEPAQAVALPGVFQWVRWATTFGVLLVALVAAIGSYEHMRALGLQVGEGWRAALLPFSVDGLALVATMTMLVRRWTGQRAGFLAWSALGVALGVSLAANVAAAEPTAEARLWAAWPPVGLLLAIELLMQQIKAWGGHGLETVRSGASNPSGEDQ